MSLGDLYDQYLVSKDYDVIRDYYIYRILKTGPG